MAHLYKANFMCEYAKSDRGKCKACDNYMRKNQLKLGTFGDNDHWNDSRWYHYKCFWTKCYYRNQLIKTDVNNPAIAGFDDLNDDDKERVKKSLAKLQETIKSKQGKLKQGNTEDSGDEWEPKKKDQDCKMFDGYKVGEHMLNIGDMRFINISKFKDIVLVALREFYKPPVKGKSLRPSKTGISLTTAQWEELCKHTSVINRAIEGMKRDSEEPTAKKQKTGKGRTKVSKSVTPTIQTRFPLSENRRVDLITTEQDGEKQVSLDIREYTIAEGGEEAPTDKGIILTNDQWASLINSTEAVDKDLAENFAVFL